MSAQATAAASQAPFMLVCMQLMSMLSCCASVVDQQDIKHTAEPATTMTATAPTCDQLCDSNHSLCSYAPPYYEQFTMCHCFNGWTSRDCSVPQCEPIKCPAGQGICVEPNVCKCLPGYSGASCTQRVCSQCAERDCIGFERCRCELGLTGPSCDQDFDECTDANACQQRSCVNTFGSFYCGCKSYEFPEIYHGRKVCLLRDCGDYNPCEYKGSCTVTFKGTLTCSCPSIWFDVDGDGSSCVMSAPAYLIATGGLTAMFVMIWLTYDLLRRGRRSTVHRFGRRQVRPLTQLLFAWLVVLT